VSLKGRGADIFFGDYTPPADGPSTVTEDPAAETAETDVALVTAEPMRAEPTEPSGSGRPRRSSGRQAGPTRPVQASKHASLQASTEGQTDAVLSDSVQASMQAYKHASLQANTDSGDNDGQPGSEPSGGRTGVQADTSTAPLDERAGVGERPAAAGVSLAGLDGDIWTRLDAAATITSSFRYTEAELTALTDVLYEVGKQYGARVTKQDVARLALNAVLEDYYQRGSHSLLAHLATRRRRRTGG